MKEGKVIGSTMWQRSPRGTGKASSIAQDFVKDNSLAERKSQENGKVFSKRQTSKAYKTPNHRNSSSSMELKPNKQKTEKAWKI